VAIKCNFPNLTSLLSGYNPNPFMITPIAPSWPVKTSVAASSLESVEGLVTPYRQRVPAFRVSRVSDKTEHILNGSLAETLGRSIRQTISTWPADRKAGYEMDFAAFNLHSSAIEGVELDEAALMGGMR
jgi:hypothetical protein